MTRRAFYDRLADLTGRAGDKVSAFFYELALRFSLAGDGETPGDYATLDPEDMP